MCFTGHRPITRMRLGGSDLKPVWNFASPSKQTVITPASPSFILRLHAWEINPTTDKLAALHIALRNVDAFLDTIITIVLFFIVQQSVYHLCTFSNVRSPTNLKTFLFFKNLQLGVKIGQVLNFVSDFSGIENSLFSSSNKPQSYC